LASWEVGNLVVFSEFPNEGTDFFERVGAGLAVAAFVVSPRLKFATAMFKESADFLKEVVDY
jgi:hypothetical protein